MTPNPRSALDEVVAARPSASQSTEGLLLPEDEVPPKEGKCTILIGPYPSFQKYTDY